VSSVERLLECSAKRTEWHGYGTKEQVRCYRFRFWTTMIARIEAIMSFKLRINSKKGLSARFILSETPVCESATAGPLATIS
jgi:hypothetical protein